jgi:superoxide dismutase
MFRTVRLSIIRSLFTVHSAMVYVIQVCRQISSRIRMELSSYTDFKQDQHGTEFVDIIQAGSGWNWVCRQNSRRIRIELSFLTAFEQDQDGTEFVYKFQAGSGWNWVWRQNSSKIRMELSLYTDFKQDLDWNEFVDSFQAGSGWNSIPSWSCLKFVYIPVWHIPLLSVQWINSWWWTEELSETFRISFQNKFVKLVHLVGFTIKKFITMHGHMNVKKPCRHLSPPTCMSHSPPISSSLILSP